MPRLCVTPLVELWELAADGCSTQHHTWYRKHTLFRKNGRELRGKLASRKETNLFLFFPESSHLESRTDWLLHFINSCQRNNELRKLKIVTASKYLSFGKDNRVSSGDPWVVIVRTVFFHFLHFSLFSNFYNEQLLMYNQDESVVGKGGGRGGT